MMKAIKYNWIATLYVFYLRVWESQTTSMCAFFYFLNITNKTLTVRENTLINITFQVIDVACGHAEINYIQIRKNMFRQCEFEISFGTCVVSPPSSFCYCLPKSRSYRFLKTLQRSDKAHWKWTAIGEESNTLAEENIIFDITYQANVTRLDINMSNGSRFALVQIADKVRIICSWVNGNPPTVIRLLNSDGRALITSNRSGDIIYFIKHAQCDDAGTITCEAEGSDKNMSALLLVVCPPSFGNTSFKQFDVDYGKINEVSFKIRAYTSFITTCILRHLLIETGIDGYNTFPCTIYNNGKASDLNTNSESVSLLVKCGCRILGTAPDLTLIVHLHNTTETDSGRWQLILSNYNGSSDVNFWIKVNKGPPKFDSASDSNVTATLGSTVHVKFSVFTHSFDFTLCQLSKHRDVIGAAVHDVIIVYKCSLLVVKAALGKPNKIQYEMPNEKCFCYVNGTSPHIFVQVFLYDIKEQDNGQWNLTLANDVGNGETNFKLQILKGEAESEKRAETTTIVLIISCTVALTIISLSIILLFFIKRGGIIYDRPKQTTTQEIDSYRIISLDEVVSPITESTHGVISVYEEISHVFPTTNTGDNCETRENTQRSKENHQGDYVEAISDDLGKGNPSTPSSSTSSDNISSGRPCYLHAMS